MSFGARAARRLAAALIGMVALGAASMAGAQQRTVAITQFAAHAALDAVRIGVIEGLTAAGWRDGQRLRLLISNADGDPARAADIARDLRNAEVDVVVPIATPSAQAVAENAAGLATVYAAVGDPAGAGLVPGAGRRITGVSDPTLTRETFELIQELFPDARWIGLLRSTGEANSEAIAGAMTWWAPGYDFRIHDVVVPAPEALAATARDVVENVEVLYLPRDNGIAARLDTVLAAAAANQIPVVAGSAEMVRAGALAGLGADYYALGRNVAAIVVRVLGGDDPNDIAPRVNPATDLTINTRVAAALEFRFPQSILDRAKTVHR